MPALEYVRNLNHNYLRFSCDIEKTDGFYQFKMITENKIVGLLESDIRTIDGQSFLYYNITSTQSLRNLFMKKEIEMEWLKDFLLTLKRLARELEAHLLDVKNIIYSPDCIFQDIETGNTFFTYYPNYEPEMNLNMGALAEFLIDKINHQDETLVKCSYELYEKMEFADDTFHPKSWLDMVLQTEQRIKDKTREEAVKEEDVNEMEMVWEDGDGRTEYRKSENRKPEYRKLENRGQENRKPENKELENRERENCINVKSDMEVENETGKRMPLSIRHILIACIPCSALIIGGVLFLIVNNYVLAWENMLLLLGGGGAVFTVITFVVLYNIRKLTGSQRGENSKKLNRKEWIDQIMNDKSVKELYQSLSEDNTGTEMCISEEYGKTVYMDTRQIENKLYGMGKHNNRIISMERYPYTIGKGKEYVDGVITDSSISRMHARFTMEREIVFLEDLNSTNGTFKNGLRLEPYEKVEVYKEDEIRFGKMQFVYR